MLHLVSGRLVWLCLINWFRYMAQNSLSFLQGLRLAMFSSSMSRLRMTLLQLGFSLVQQNSQRKKKLTEIV